MITKHKVIFGFSIIAVIAASFLLFSFGTVVGGKLYHGIQAHNGTTDKIEKVLNKNCNCDAEFAFSSFGIHFSKEDGVNGNTVVFNLKEFTSDTSIEEEAARIHLLLKEEVQDYNDLDLVQLNFVGEQETTQITIKNGEIQ